MKAKMFFFLPLCLILFGLPRDQGQEPLAKQSNLTMEPSLRQDIAVTTTPVRHGTVENLGATRQQVLASYGKLPLSFEMNQGQTDERVKFLSRGSGYTLFLTSTEAVLALDKHQPSVARHLGPKPVRNQQTSTTILRIKLLGANPAPQVVGLGEPPGRSNYFLGNDPKKWHTSVASYARVKYHNVYPGVDLVYYGNQGQFENDFIVAPGASPSVITLEVQAASRLNIDAQGDLVLQTQHGQIRLHRPHVYQEEKGSRQDIAGRYVFRGKRRVGFEVAAYDTTRPLVIDPVLVYSTYLGGSLDDQGWGIKVDSSGKAYITGTTASTNFPTRGAFQPSYGGDPGDVFVAKLDMNAVGSASLVYSTYLGGRGDDAAENIFVDSAGNLYVTGTTSSTNFPTTPGAYQTSYGGGVSDAFVTKLNSAGNSLLYSTYLGGSGNDIGEELAVDPGGNIYVIGITSGSFPTTANAFKTTYGGGTSDVFVTKLNPAAVAPASALVYSTYLGGSGDDSGEALVLDPDNNVYVIGDTSSTNDFPTTLGAFQTAYGGGLHDAFVSKLDMTKVGLASLVYSTYLGGSGDDFARGLVLDSTRNVYVTGFTSSMNFRTTAGALQTTYGGGPHDAFITKLNANGNALVYSTYLGGSGDDGGEGIALDSAGNIYVVGSTASTDFRTTQGAFQATYGGGIADGFVTKLNANGNALVYSTYLGGSEYDIIRGLSLDTAGNAYVVGTTLSLNFPTANPFQASKAGGFDAFAAKLTNLSDLAISVSPSSVTVNRGQPATYTVTAAPQNGAFSDPVSLACSNLPARTSCSFNPSSVTPGANPATSTLTVSTTSASALFRAPHGEPGPPPVFSLCLGLAALALFGASLVIKRSKISKLGYCLSLGIFLAVLAVGCTGGGSSAQPGTQPGTPGGTFTITITGTSGSFQRSTTASLVVQ